MSALARIVVIAAAVALLIALALDSAALSQLSLAALLALLLWDSEVES